MGETAWIDPKDGKPLRLVGAFIRRTDLTSASLRGASLRGANLTRADLTGAVARDADFAGAKLRKTVLHGTDLTGARNLTIEQLAEASIDEATVLPDYIDRAALKRLQRARRGKLL